MDKVHEYEVSVRWEQGRRGILSAPTQKNNIEVATPPQFSKGIAGIWSPEELFTAAVNSCLMTTFLAIAENSKLDYSVFESKAMGSLAIVEGKYEMNEVTLMPVLTIDREEDREKAMRVLQKSEAACLISNSIKSKIIFQPEVKVAVPVEGQGV